MSKICELCYEETDLITIINGIHACKICATPIIKLEMIDPRNYTEKHWINYDEFFLLYRPKTDIIIKSPLGFMKYIFYKDTLYHLKDPRTNYPPHWYILFREQVKRINKYQCVRCNSTNDLQIHHITRVKEDTSRLLDLENVVLLCRECHEQEHRDAQTFPTWDGTYDNCPLCGGSKKSSFEICYDCSGRNYY